ncbi:MAG: VWA domain-containing protein [Treponema sp.]|nr:VWA domain-containing protein [Treponema sp.]
MADKYTGKKTIFLLFALFLAAAPLFAQDLSIDPDDIRLEQRSYAGFHLFIRKKPEIASVLLTESTRDPAMAADNFAYRAPEWNPINGDEIRLLNGFPIPRESRIFSLISSSPEIHPELGEAFHIFVPWIVHYGYENTRHGEVYMADGTYINIRAFNLPYADYRGSFADNPFTLQAVQHIHEELRGTYDDEAARSFSDIARQGGGDFLSASSPAELVEVIEDLLRQEAGKDVDIVICFDTTGSMAPYIDEIRRRLIPIVRRTIASFNSWRIGMVLYRDYPPDAYITRLLPFTRDFNYFQRYLNIATAWGGGDTPEAVYEALYDAADKFNWAAESRLIILVGDAPPHPVPKGKITGEMVFQLADEKGIKISAILLPN